MPERPWSHTDPCACKIHEDTSWDLVLQCELSAHMDEGASREGDGTGRLREQLVWGRRQGFTEAGNCGLPVEEHQGRSL